MKPLISVLIVTWNSRNEIGGCLRSIEEEVHEFGYETLVVDNASTDGTVEFVRSEFPGTKVIENVTNRGFAGGNNQGIHIARGRYLLLLNPDTIVRPNAFSALVSYLEQHPHVGAVGPRLIEADGRIQRSGIRYPSARSLLRAFLKGGGYIPSLEGPAAVAALSAAALMVRSDVMRAVGCLDTDFFMYGEDTELCYRLRRAGWEIHYLPWAQVTHLRGRSGRSLPAQVYVWRRTGKLIFLKKHGSAVQFWLQAYLLAMGILLRKLRVKTAERAAYLDEVWRLYWTMLATLR